MSQFMHHIIADILLLITIYFSEHFLPIPEENKDIDNFINKWF